jgi:hypothetical protein
VGKLTGCRAGTRQVTRFMLDPADFCSRPDMLDGTYVSSLCDKSGKPRALHGLRSLTPLHSLLHARIARADDEEEAESSSKVARLDLDLASQPLLEV